MVVKLIFLGGIGVLGLLLFAFGVVVGLERRVTVNFGGRIEELKEAEEPLFADEARELIDSEFKSLLTQVVERRAPAASELPAAQRLAALESKKGPMPEFIRDLFNKD